MDSSREFEEINLTGHTIRYFDQLDSTNAYLEKEAVSDNLPNGFTVVADFQKSGKGQRGSTWYSEQNKNLLFSILYIPKNMKADSQFYLSKALCISILRTLRKWINKSSIQIKWPNDVLVNQRKIAGTLIQCNLKGFDVQHVIIGIGLNVNQVDFGPIKQATSIFKETGLELGKKRILADFFNHYDQNIKLLEESNYSALDDDYHQHLFGFKTWQILAGKKGEFRGRIMEVSSDGKLVVENELGIISRFAITEVSQALTPPIG